MLKRCEDTNLVLNWEKCHFMCREGIVLGHKISKSGIEVDRAKVDVIAKLPHPTTVKARPMTHLLQKETPFVFSKDCINAFHTLKKKLTEALILVVPDWNLPFELICDASDFAIGAEMLAVVYAFEKFRPYLFLSKSIVYTDHSALKYLMNKQDAKPRYGYINNHKKTVKNGQARTRESEEFKAEARKVNPFSKSAKKSQTSKSRKAANNHDPLALLAHSNASSSQSHANSFYSPQIYYVTHSSSVADYENEYQGELQEDSQEDKDGRIDIQTKNAGYGGNGNRNSGRQNRNQAFNAGNRNDDNRLDCHYVHDCQKPRVHDAKYFREQMLLAMKDEAESNLKDEENDFMLDSSYGDETLEELIVAVIMMARIQPADDNADSEPSYDAKLAKKAFKERENRYLDDIIDLEEKLSSHDRIVYKMAGLGYKNPERLKKAIAAQPKMYHGEMLHSTNLKIDSPDSEETLEDAEESRLK
ncbi:reverse transcriptase domain-containing protein [Tanacetum coccineum]